MAENTLEIETENRRASIVRAEKLVAETEMIADNSAYTKDALAALRWKLKGEKTILAKLERYQRNRPQPQ